MVYFLRRMMVASIVAGFLAACAGEKPDNLGVHDGRLMECPASPNCVSSQALDEAHRIQALAFGDRADSAFARLKQTLGLRKDVTLIETRPEYLRVEFHTLLFTDDGEFLMDEKQRLIHVRSASRLGYSDLGKNRSRLEEIRRQFAESENKP